MDREQMSTHSESRARVRPVLAPLHCGTRSMRYGSGRHDAMDTSADFVVVRCQVRVIVNAAYNCEKFCEQC
jgi:hypothetical protein